jgi:hypothetical protein
MQCSTRAVVSITINGGSPDEETSGSAPAGLQIATVTHFFGPGERITSVHVVAYVDTPNQSITGPAIVVKTSHGRCLCYGPFLTLFRLRTIVYSFWIGEGEEIAGFLCDPVKAEDPDLRTFGVAVRPLRNECGGTVKRPSVDDSLAFSAPSVRDVTAFRTLSCVVRFPTQMFLTKAQLLDVHTLRLQRVGPRCVGIRVERRSGLLDVLGQWDPRNEGVCLYNGGSRGGPVLESLTFVLSSANQPTERYVEDVFLNAGLTQSVPGTATSFTWSRLDEVSPQPHPLD